MNRLDVVEQVVSCTNCELHTQCTAPVALRGPEWARIAVIGEAPGRQEDTHGQPFIGPAGQLLTELLTEVGIDEDIAYINTVSCFPDGTPTWEHIAACDHNKQAQLNLIDPIYVLLVGRVALKATRADLDLKRGRGRPFLHDRRIHYATYHPAAALRHGPYLDSMRDDLERFRQILDAGDRWWDFIPDVCAACPIEPAWIEETGLGWCPVDMPTDVLARYEANRSRNAAELAAARARAGMDAAEAHADPAWMTQAWATLVAYLETHQVFFVDDFWSETKLTRPRESRALGPLVQRAARDGLIKKSGEFRKSTASHMTEKPVWVSVIYAPALT